MGVKDRGIRVRAPEIFPGLERLGFRIWGLGSNSELRRSILSPVHVLEGSRFEADRHSDNIHALPNSKLFNQARHLSGPAPPRVDDDTEAIP